jgi:hypothetical protein
VKLAVVRLDVDRANRASPLIVDIAADCDRPPLPSVGEMSPRAGPLTPEIAPFTSTWTIRSPPMTGTPL